MFGWFGNSYERQRRRIHGTLRDYPVYVPPYRGRSAYKKAKENFNYFLRTKNDRKSYIEKYLTKMSVSVGDTPGEINEIGKWLRDNGGCFLPLAFTERHESQSTYAPEWTGDFLGLNVINDLAIMVGELIIARKPTARWRLFGLDKSEILHYKKVIEDEDIEDEGEKVPHYLSIQNSHVDADEDDDGDDDDEGIEGRPHYLQPCLYGVRPSLRPEYVIGAMTDACRESQFYLRGLSKTSGQWMQKTALLDYIEYLGRPDAPR
jgi:hypothetical protein